MLLGGAPLDGERYHLVELRRQFARTDRGGKGALAAQRFAAVPGETEFIPLPER